jgi:hypothetical protein
MCDDFAVMQGFVSARFRGLFDGPYQKEMIKLLVLNGDFVAYVVLFPLWD